MESDSSSPKRWPQVVLLILIFGPVPLLYVVGDAGIRSVEDAHEQSNIDEAKKRTIGWLTGTFETALNIRPDSYTYDDFNLGPPVVLRRGENPWELAPSFDLCFDIPFVRQFWPDTGDASRALSALDQVSSWFSNEDPRLAIMARICAIRSLVTLEQREWVNVLRQQVEERPEELDDRTLLHRFMSVVAAPEDEEGPLLQRWASEVRTRGTSIQEIQFIHALDSNALDLQGRTELARAGARVRDLWRVHEYAERCLFACEGSCFLIDSLDGETRLHEVLNWQEALRMKGCAWKLATDDNSLWALSVPSVTCDFGEHRLVPYVDGSSSAFADWKPHWLLAFVLAIYALVAGLILRNLLIQSRRSRELAETRGELIAQVAHELRTPLSVLRMYAETLRQGRLPESKRDHYVATIAEESYRLGHAIDRVAEVARGDQLDDEPLRPVDLNALVAQTVGSFLALGEQDPPWVTFHEDQESLVLAQAEGLRSVLTILLENAERYGAPPVVVTLNKNPGQRTVSLRIQDQGPGLSRDELDAVFGKWFRGKASRESGRRGVGMGLFLARQHAVRFGGSLIAERSDQGARFCLTLPLAEESAPSDLAKGSSA